MISATEVPASGAPESAPGLELLAGGAADHAALRAELRAFIATYAPKFPIRAGVRSPESADEQQQLRAWTAALFAAGYVGGDWPVEYAGSGAEDPVRAGVIAQELALAHVPGPVGGSVLASRALLGFGTSEQCARYLPPIRSGAQIWCQLFSEPGAGSDLGSLRTKAELDGEHYVVNGQKVWTTNGHWADMGYLLARTDPDVPKHQGITAFALDMHAPGVTVRPLREMTGTADFNEVFFDDVRVPVNNVIGAPGQGWAVANASLSHERTGVGANVVALQASWRALWSRAQLITDSGGTSLADQPDVCQRLISLYADIEVLDALITQGLERWLGGGERPQDAPYAKLLFSEINLALAEAAVDILGARGVFVEGDADAVDDGRWQDAFLYARAYTIAGGSSEIMRNLIAERGLGLPR